MCECRVSGEFTVLFCARCVDGLVYTPDWRLCWTCTPSTWTSHDLKLT